MSDTARKRWRSGLKRRTPSARSAFAEAMYRNGAALIADNRAKAARIAELEEALRWYGEQARLARLIHREGDAGRHALADDGGKRAQAFFPINGEG